MIFSDFLKWLNDQLALFIGNNTALIANAITPAATLCAAIYVMGWGYLHLSGRIEEPITEGFKRILVIGVIFGIGLSLWSYNTLIVDTVFTTPSQLAARIAGTKDPTTVVDTIWTNGGYVASVLWEKAGVMNGEFGFYLAGGAVYVVVGLLAGYATFLFALSKVGLAVCLALGPIAIVLLFFESSKRFFEAWVAKLANYAFITLLAVLVSSLMLQAVETYAVQTARLGNAVVTVDALNMLLMSVVVGLIFAQVTSIAAGLSSGVALATYGTFASAISWAMRGVRRTGYDLGRGVIDGSRREGFGKYDSLTRGAGNLLGRGARNAYDRLAKRTGGKVGPREP